MKSHSQHYCKSIHCVSLGGHEPVNKSVNLLTMSKQLARGMTILYGEPAAVAWALVLNMDIGVFSVATIIKRTSREQHDRSVQQKQLHADFSFSVLHHTCLEWVGVHWTRPMSFLFVCQCRLVLYLMWLCMNYQ